MKILQRFPFSPALETSSTEINTQERLFSRCPFACLRANFSLPPICPPLIFLERQICEFQIPNTSKSASKVKLVEMKPCMERKILCEK